MLARMLDMKLHATLSTIGLMYLGDHSMKMPLPLPLFKSLAWVYHQMWRQDLKQEHAYLLAPLPPPVSASADATIYVPSTHILLYMCPHTILLYMCQHTIRRYLGATRCCRRRGRVRRSAAIIGGPKGGTMPERPVRQW